MLPTKVKFFGWFMDFGRLSTGANMYRENIHALEDSCCEFCPSVLETDIFSKCPRSAADWTQPGVEITARRHKNPWFIGCSLSLPDDVRTNMFLTLLWHIWKAKNEKIFD
jgi:hypothetical protein